MQVPFIDAVASPVIVVDLQICTTMQFKKTNEDPYLNHETANPLVVVSGGSGVHWPHSEIMF